MSYSIPLRYVQKKKKQSTSKRETNVNAKLRQALVTRNEPRDGKGRTTGNTRKGPWTFMIRPFPLLFLFLFAIRSLMCLVPRRREMVVNRQAQCIHTHTEDT